MLDSRCWFKFKQDKKKQNNNSPFDSIFQFFWSQTMALCEKQIEIRWKMLFNDNFSLLQSLQMLWSIAIITECFIIKTISLAVLDWCQTYY